VQAHNFERSGTVVAVLISDLPPVSIGWAFRTQDMLPSIAQSYITIVDRELQSFKRIRGFDIL
jgi:hypothetical protein